MARQRLSSRERRQRRRQRLVSIFGFVLSTVALAWYFESQATTTILFVRHADTDAITLEQDPPLNARGLARAELLADFVEDIDVLAGLDAIYASEYRRTQQTAAPLAKRLDMPVDVADHGDAEPFMERVLRDHKGEIVLVVTHADDIPPLVAELHGHQNVPEIGSDEYDNFYIVSVPWFAKVKTLRLHYGVGWTEPDLRFSGGSSGSAFTDQ